MRHLDAGCRFRLLRLHSRSGSTMRFEAGALDDCPVRTCNSLNLASRRTARALAAALKPIDQAATLDAAAGVRRQ